jgi:hypothetical protein
MLPLAAISWKPGALIFKTKVVEAVKVPDVPVTVI